MAVPEMSRGVGRVSGDCEVAKVINQVRFLSCPYEKLVAVFAVYKSRDAQHAGYIGSGSVSPELGGQGSQKRFSLISVESVDAPDHLVFFWRSIQNEIGSGNLS
jgi:hypothetical protein